MQHLKIRIASAIAAIAALLLTPAPANASDALAEDPNVDSCANEALSHGYAQWACFGDTLNYVAGAARSESPITPERWSTRLIEDSHTASTSGAATTLSSTDDTWCEYGSVCHSTMSDYASKAKGNAAYGDANGVIGTFDVVLRTTLNGRQPRYTVSFYHDSGPTVVITSQVNCVKDQTFDASCGHFSVGKRTVSDYWNSGLIYGNRIADNLPDNYFSTITGSFTASGRSYQLGTLRSVDFICPSGSGGCTFP